MIALTFLVGFLCRAFCVSFLACKLFGLPGLPWISPSITPRLAACMLSQGTTKVSARILSGRARVMRAWKAGAWAKLVLKGATGISVPSTVLSSPSRFYAVVGGTGIQQATVHTVP